MRRQLDTRLRFLATTSVLIGSCFLLGIPYENWMVYHQTNPSSYHTLQTKSACPSRATCIDAGFLQGEWVFRPNRNRSETMFLPRAYMADDERAFRTVNKSATEQLSWNRYDWVTENPCCEMQNFGRERMCQTFQRWGVRRLLFVGDSIQHQIVATLLGMLRASGDAEEVHSSPDKVARVKACDDELTIMYVRNDNLYTESHFREDWPHSNPWTQLLHGHEVPDMLMLNMGPHVYKQEEFESWMDATVKYLEANYTGQIVYRTYPPGHPNCWEYETPVFNKSYNYDGMLEESFGGQYWHWWGRYADFNAYARRVLPQAIFLDVVPLNKDRPDGHMLGVWKDCLHYHMPGPIDWWVIYFQNLLEARDPPTRTQRIGGLDMVEEISRRR